MRFLQKKTIHNVSYNKAFLAIGLAYSVADDADGQLIGDELAGVHVGLRLHTERRTALDGGAEHIAGRDMRETELFHQAISLSAFTCAGGA